MTEATTRLRVKLGGAEIEYEGNAAFLKDEILPRVDNILNMVRERSDLRVLAAPSNPTATARLAPTIHDPELSTSTIATVCSAQSAGDLVLAAAAKLIIVDGKPTATRSEILTEMKGAVAFYKSTMNNNLTATLKRLVRDDRLRSGASDTYSLSNSEREALEQKIALGQ